VVTIALAAGMIEAPPQPQTLQQADSTTFETDKTTAVENVGPAVVTTVAAKLDQKIILARYLAAKREAADLSPASAAWRSTKTSPISILWLPSCPVMKWRSLW